MRWGVGRGDRVGLWLPKSLEAVTAIHGILRTGASYVPVDPTGPPGRAAGILAASGVKAVVVAAELMPALHEAYPGGGPRPRLIVVDEDSGARDGHGPESDDPLPSSVVAGDARWSEVIADDAPSPLMPPRAADDLAYILFTSGSTGQPKGVMLSHANAFTFLDWCQRTLGPWNDDDRFASHAPFHFDLSVFDLFAACQGASTLVLIGENLGKDPVALGEFLTERRISIWYSAPSILALLAERGKLERPGHQCAPSGVVCRRSVSHRRLSQSCGSYGLGQRCGTCTGRPRRTLHRISDSRQDPARSNRAVPDRDGLHAAPCARRRRTGL